MIPVCADVENTGAKSMWFYAEGVYKRLCKGLNLAQITGKNLPDPMQLWRQRCEVNGLPFPTESFISQKSRGHEVRLKPTEAAFRLFEHWQNVCSAEAQGVQNAITHH